MPKSAEMILNPGLLSVVVVEPFGPAFAEVLAKLGEDSAIQAIECVSAMDALAVVRQLSSCVVLVHGGTPHEISSHLSLIKALAPQIQQKRIVRLIATVEADVQPEQIEKLTIYGAAEVLPDSMPAKALLFKLDRHLKSLPAAVDHALAAANMKSVGLSPTAAAAAEHEIARAPGPGPGVRLTAELGAAGVTDLWSMWGGGVKKQKDFWEICLRGPAPEQGRWIAGAGGVWRWVENSELAVGTGNFEARGWLFSESETSPEYQRGYWSFTSKNPSLAYLVEEGGEALGHKFRVNAKGSLCIARDRSEKRAVLEAPVVEEDFSSVAAPVEPEASVPEASLVVALGEARVLWTEALKIASDFWVVGKFQPKRVADRWLVQLVGPGPAIGKWVGKGVETAAHERWWRWEPEAKELDPFHKELGGWFFYGLAPNFLGGVWSFASSRPELGFYCKGACHGDRFKIRTDGALEISRDSQAALAAWPMIKVSFARTVPPHPEGTRLVAPLAVALRPPVPREDPRSDWVPAAPVAETVVGDESFRLADPVEPAVGGGPINTILPPEDLRAIFAAEPPGPTLTPLSLLFLASELVAKRGTDVRWRCDRYCTYLHASFGGLRVELWIELGAGTESAAWHCVGSSRESDPQGLLKEAVRGGAGVRQWNGEPALVTEVRPSLQNHIGYLVIAGRGAHKIADDYALVAAKAAVGLVFGARTEVKGRVRAEESVA